MKFARPTATVTGISRKRLHLLTLVTLILVILCVNVFFFHIQKTDDGTGGDFATGKRENGVKNEEMGVSTIDNNNRGRDSAADRRRRDDAMEANEDSSQVSAGGWVLQNPSSGTLLPLSIVESLSEQCAALSEISLYQETSLSSSSAYSSLRILNRMAHVKNLLQVLSREIIAQKERRIVEENCAADGAKEISSFLTCSDMLMDARFDKTTPSFHLAVTGLSSSSTGGNIEEISNFYFHIFQAVIVPASHFPSLIYLYDMTEMNNAVLQYLDVIRDCTKLKISKTTTSSSRDNMYPPGAKGPTILQYRPMRILFNPISWHQTISRLLLTKEAVSISSSSLISAVNHNNGKSSVASKENEKTAQVKKKEDYVHDALLEHFPRSGANGKKSVGNIIWTSTLHSNFLTTAKRRKLPESRKGEEKSAEENGKEKTQRTSKRKGAMDMLIHSVSSHGSLLELHGVLQALLWQQVYCMVVIGRRVVDDRRRSIEDSDEDGSNPITLCLQEYLKKGREGKKISKTEKKQHDEEERDELEKSSGRQDDNDTDDNDVLLSDASDAFLFSQSPRQKDTNPDHGTPIRRDGEKGGKEIDGKSEYDFITNWMHRITVGKVASSDRLLFFNNENSLRKTYRELLEEILKKRRKKEGLDEEEATIHHAEKNNDDANIETEIQLSFSSLGFLQSYLVLMLESSMVGAYTEEDGIGIPELLLQSDSFSHLPSWYEQVIAETCRVLRKEMTIHAIQQMTSFSQHRQHQHSRSSLMDTVTEEEKSQLWSGEDNNEGHSLLKANQQRRQGEKSGQRRKNKEKEGERFQEDDVEKYKIAARRVIAMIHEFLSVSRLISLEAINTFHDLARSLRNNPKRKKDQTSNVNIRDDLDNAEISSWLDLAPWRIELSSVMAGMFVLSKKSTNPPTAEELRPSEVVDGVGRYGKKKNENGFQNKGKKEKRESKISSTGIAVAKRRWMPMSFRPRYSLSNAQEVITKLLTEMHQAQYIQRSFEARAMNENIQTLRREVLLKRSSPHDESENEADVGEYSELTKLRSFDSNKNVIDDTLSFIHLLPQCATYAAEMSLCSLQFASKTCDRFCLGSMKSAVGGESHTAGRSANVGHQGRIGMAEAEHVAVFTPLSPTMQRLTLMSSLIRSVMTRHRLNLMQFWIKKKNERRGGSNKTFWEGKRQDSDDGVNALHPFPSHSFISTVPPFLKMMVNIGALGARNILAATHSFDYITFLQNWLDDHFLRAEGTSSFHQQRVHALKGDEKLRSSAISSVAVLQCHLGLLLPALQATLKSSRKNAKLMVGVVNDLTDEKVLKDKVLSPNYQSNSANVNDAQQGGGTSSLGSSYLDSFTQGTSLDMYDESKCATQIRLIASLAVSPMLHDKQEPEGHGLVGRNPKDVSQNKRRKLQSDILPAYAGKEELERLAEQGMERNVDVNAFMRKISFFRMNDATSFHSASVVILSAFTLYYAQHWSPFDNFKAKKYILIFDTNDFAVMECRAVEQSLVRRQSLLNAHEGLLSSTETNNKKQKTDEGRDLLGTTWDARAESFGMASTRNEEESEDVMGEGRAARSILYRSNRLSSAMGQQLQQRQFGNDKQRFVDKNMAKNGSNLKAEQKQQIGQRRRKKEKVVIMPKRFVLESVLYYGTGMQIWRREN